MSGVNRFVRCLSTAAAGLALGAAAPAGSSATVVRPTIDVLSTTPLSGAGVDDDKVPAAVTTIDSRQIEQERSPDIVESLNVTTPSVDVQDVAGNPFQPDVYFRGFDASSVSGAPQGLTVYQNGTRINEAFGDTVNWDLTPTTAVRTIDVISNNPAFGPNALGGARSIQIKDGFTFDGPVSLRTTGLYVLDTFDVTNAFSVSAGGRLNVANIQLQDQLGSSLNETICLCASIR
jgi:outer membrane cobalamin receptor